MNETIFDKLDFGPLKPLLDNDDITDISYCNGGQIWIRSLTQGSIRVEVPGCTQEFMEKLAFQCSNVMGTTFNNAKSFLDAESSELRLNFVHQSIATNGIACVLRKTPAKIRLKKEKLLEDDYFTVKFVSTKGIPPKIQDVYDAINEVKASWLDIDYEFIFNTVNYLRKFTVRELRQYTVEELREKELQHLGLSKKYLTDENGNKLTDRLNKKLITFSWGE